MNLYSSRYFLKKENKKASTIGVHTNQVMCTFSDMSLRVHMYEAMPNDDLLLSKLPYGISRKKEKLGVVLCIMILAEVRGGCLEPDM